MYQQLPRSKLEKEQALEEKKKALEKTIILQKEVKLEKKKADVGIEIVIKKSKKYDLMMANFQNSQGLRLGCGERSLQPSNRK